MERCICGTTMTKHDWKHQYVCHTCGRTKPISDDSRDKLRTLIDELNDEEIESLIRVLEDRY